MFFYRDIGHYVIKEYDLIHEGHIINEVSILTHGRIESDLTKYKKNQFAILGKMGGTAQNAKN